MILCLQDFWTTSLNYNNPTTTIPIRVDLTTPQAVCTLQASICIIEIGHAMGIIYSYFMPVCSKVKTITPPPPPPPPRGAVCDPVHSARGLRPRVIVHQVVHGNEG